uniref:Putative ovule protein n=1 Tax=Solanum chacoense TaxID=4108 RepID=A0A0V0IGR4_SOLCH
MIRKIIWGVTSLVLNFYIYFFHYVTYHFFKFQGQLPVALFIVYFLNISFNICQYESMHEAENWWRLKNGICS